MFGCHLMLSCKPYLKMIADYSLLSTDELKKPQNYLLWLLSMLSLLSHFHLSLEHFTLLLNAHLAHSGI